MEVDNYEKVYLPVLTVSANVTAVSTNRVYTY